MSDERKQQIRVRYDGEARTLYLHVAVGDHNTTVEVEPLCIYADVDEDGNLLGLEALNLQELHQLDGLVLSSEDSEIWAACVKAITPILQAGIRAIAAKRESA